MAHVDQNIVEMPDDESVALMPPFSEPAAPWPLATSFALLGAALILDV